MLNRSEAPTIKDAIDFNYYLPPISNIIMKNGIPLYIYEGGAQEVVQIEWVFEGGLWNEKKNGVAQAVAALMKNGTISHKEAELNEELEFYGASFKIATSNDYSTLILHCLTKHLKNILPVIFEILTEASYLESELEIYKKNALQALQVKLLKSDFVANRLIEEKIFGAKHPYGRYIIEEDLNLLQREDLIDYHYSNLQYSNCKIFIAGRIQKEDINYLEQLFGLEKWNQSIYIPTLDHHVLRSDEKKLMLINNEDGVQAAIRMALPFVSKDHEDFLPMQMVNTIFGGYFGSRLMSNIREEKGYTYGIYSYVASFKNESMLVITTEVGRKVAQNTIDEIVIEMNRLKDVIVDEQELLLVKNYLLGGLLSDLDGPFSIMRFWKSLILNDQSIEDFNSRIKLFKEIDAPRIQEIARKYYHIDDFFQVVVV